MLMVEPRKLPAEEQNALAVRRIEESFSARLYM